MGTFFARRLLSTLPVLLIVAVLVFLMLRLTPGDPAAVLAGDAASTEQIAQIRAGLGLDRSIPEQFAIWFGRLVTGDLGQSFYYKTAVTDLIGQRLEPTVSLAALTIVIAVLMVNGERLGGETPQRSHPRDSLDGLGLGQVQDLSPQGLRFHVAPLAAVPERKAIERLRFHLGGA